MDINPGPGVEPSVCVIPSKTPSSGISPPPFPLHPLWGRHPGRHTEVYFKKIIYKRSFVSVFWQASASQPARGGGMGGYERPSIKMLGQAAEGGRRPGEVGFRGLRPLLVWGSWEV